MSSPTRPPDPVRLTDREQAVLAAIAAHEHRADAAFGNRLARGRPARLPGARGTRSWRVGLAVGLPAAIAAVGTLLLVLPGPWAVAVVAVAVLVVVPPVLVVWAARQSA